MSPHPEPTGGPSRLVLVVGAVALRAVLAFLDLSILVVVLVTEALDALARLFTSWVTPQHPDTRLALWVSVPIRLMGAVQMGLDRLGRLLAEVLGIPLPLLERIRRGLEARYQRTLVTVSSSQGLARR